MEHEVADVRRDELASFALEVEAVHVINAYESLKNSRGHFLLVDKLKNPRKQILLCLGLSAALKHWVENDGLVVRGAEAEDLLQSLAVVPGEIFYKDSLSVRL